MLSNVKITVYKRRKLNKKKNTQTYTTAKAFVSDAHAGNSSISTL